MNDVIHNVERSLARRCNLTFGFKCGLVQVLSMYGGPLEFLFVVENKEDPAYDSILQMMHELEVSFHFLCFQLVQKH